MFENASPSPWHIEGNVIYRVDDVDDSAIRTTQKKTEIARFRIFQVLGESKLKGVSVDEAHDNAALVGTAVNFYAQAEKFLELAMKQGSPRLAEEAAKLRDEFYAKGDVSQD